MENKKYNPNTVKNLKKLNEDNLPKIIELQQVILGAEFDRPVSFDEALEIMKSRLKEGEELGDAYKVMGVYVDDGSNTTIDKPEKKIERPNIKIDFNAPAESIQTAKLNFGGKN